MHPMVGCLCICFFLILLESQVACLSTDSLENDEASLLQLLDRSAIVQNQKGDNNGKHTAGIAQVLNGSLSMANDSNTLNRGSPVSGLGNGSVSLNPNKLSPTPSKILIRDTMLMIVLLFMFCLIALLCCRVKRADAKRRPEFETAIPISFDGIPIHAQYIKALEEMKRQLKLSLSCHQQLMNHYRYWYHFCLIPSIVVNACVPIAAACVPVSTQWKWITRQSCVVALGCISTMLVGISYLDDTKSSMQKHQRAVDQLHILRKHYGFEIEFPVKFEGADPRSLFAEFQPIMQSTYSNMVVEPISIATEEIPRLYEIEPLAPSWRGIGSVAAAKVKAVAAAAAADYGLDIHREKDDDYKTYCRGLDMMREKILLNLYLHEKASKEYKFRYQLYTIPTFVCTACAPLVEAIFVADESTRQLIVLVLGCVSTILIGISSLEDSKSLEEEHDAAINIFGDVLWYYRVKIDTPVRLHMLQAREAYLKLKAKYSKTLDLIGIPDFIYEKYLERFREERCHCCEPMLPEEGTEDLTTV